MISYLRRLFGKRPEPLPPVEEVEELAAKLRDAEEPLDLPSICEVGEPLNKKEFPLYTPADAKWLQEKKTSFLETLTEEEIKTLKGAMIASRTNYLTAIRIIAKDQDKNPAYMLEQQGLLEDVLRRYVKGDGVAGVADDYQMQPGKLREFLEPLGFTEEEFPLHDED